MSQFKNDYGMSRTKLDSVAEREQCIYKPGFQFREEALEFFRLCVGRDAYNRAMSSEAGKNNHYVVARAFLSQSDWEKFVWIEKHGSLVGFPE